MLANTHGNKLKSKLYYLQNLNKMQPNTLAIINYSCKDSNFAPQTSSNHAGFVLERLTNNKQLMMSFMA